MRKRHAARPVLESMEHRMVPTALGALDPTAGLRAAIGNLVAHHNHATPAVATHHATTRSARLEARAARHHAAATTHHTTTHHSSSSSSSSSLTSSFSNFLKSLGL
jgi:hypothetical protein